MYHAFLMMALILEELICPKMYHHLDCFVEGVWTVPSGVDYPSILEAFIEGTLNRTHEHVSPVQRSMKQATVRTHRRKELEAHLPRRPRLQVG